MNYKLEESVNHRIATVATLLKRQAFRIITENNLEITPEQWVVMYHLWQENGLSVGEIARRSRKDFANVTRIVKKLEKAGYVRKNKSKNDNRSNLVFILPKADEIQNQIENCWKQSTAIATKGISKSEQELLLNLIEKMEINILENS